jgi:hypothetical protein
MFLLYILDGICCKIIQNKTMNPRVQINYYTMNMNNMRKNPREGATKDSKTGDSTDSKPNPHIKSIPFPTFIERDDERKFVQCSLCKHYDKNKQKCWLFNRDALLCRVNQDLCGYSAKYFEPHDTGSKNVYLIDGTKQCE